MIPQQSLKRTDSATRKGCFMRFCQGSNDSNRALRADGVDSIGVFTYTKRVCVCVCGYICKYTYTHTHTHPCLYVYICMYVCVYISIYIYISIYRGRLSDMIADSQDVSEP